MAFIGPWEIALIAGVIILLFGAKRIPQLARSIGEAVKQYRRAVEGEEPPENQNELNTLIRTAKKLGINTVGKTPQEISDEILRKLRKT
ncbi:MAG: twin-arginine translocase TatA/TatE family subunit [Candidatus Bathyarchaeia archaeon]